MYKYLVIVEPTDTGYSAYSPDLDGCVATGSTREDAEINMVEAIRMHLDGLMQDHSPIPPPRSTATVIAVA